MNTFDTDAGKTELHSGKKTEVIHQASNFKIRIVELLPGENIPPCEMASSVIFHVLSGAVDITSDGETASIKEGQGMVSEPATISMNSKTGARLLGIQIEKAEVGDKDG